MTKCVYTHQTTNSYDSYVLGGGSCAVLLEWGEDSYTATEHRRSHSGWDFLRDLQQDTVRQVRLNARDNLRARLDDEVGGDTSVVGVLENKSIHRVKESIFDSLLRTSCPLCLHRACRHRRRYRPYPQYKTVPYAVCTDRRRGMSRSEHRRRPSPQPKKGAR